MTTEQSGDAGPRSTDRHRDCARRLRCVDVLHEAFGRGAACVALGGKPLDNELLHIPFEPFDDFPFALQAIDAERVVVAGVNVQFVSLAQRLQLGG